MRCPFCSFNEDKVLDSRTSGKGDSIRRRRKCLSCGRRFTTYEQVEWNQVLIVKKDGRREPFERNKILNGIAIACRKRPVSLAEMERAVDDIENKIYDSGCKEFDADDIGEMVCESLKNLDQVAYVRFASVYRQFQDVGQFREILEIL